MSRYKQMTPFAIRLEWFRNQDGACWLCGEQMDLFQPVHTWGSCSWEHIIPRSSGGSDAWRNLALTHWECNKLRRDQFIFSLKRPRSRKDLQVRYCERRLRKDFDKTVRKIGAMARVTASETA